MVRAQGDGTFVRGFFAWENGTLAPAVVAERFLDKHWGGGFLAFSNKERHLRPGEDFRTLLSGRVDEAGGAEGYLMEAGLWRTEGLLHDELSLEREGDEYFFQHWRLLEQTEGEAQGMEPCLYRRARTFARPDLGPILAGMASPTGRPASVSTFEVIVPAHRVRVFLTLAVGGAE